MSAKKRTNRAIFVVLALFLLISFVLGVNNAAAAEGKPIKMKFAYFMPTKHTLHRVFEHYAQEVEALTKGKVKITLYPGGALGKPREQWDLALGGIADISFVIPAFTAGRFPLTTVFDLPLVSGGSSKVTTAVAQDIYKDYLKKEFKDAKVLFMFSSDPITIHTSKKQIKSIDDLKGLKIRSAGAIQSATIKQLGGSPVSMPITEVYTSLEKGVLDGVLTAFTAMRSFRIYDVTKYSLDMGFTCMPMIVVMNLKKWNSLSPEIQNVFDGLFRNYSFEAAGEYDNDVAKSKKYGRDNGQIIVPISNDEFAKWKESVSPLRSKWVKDMKKKGLPGQEILDAALLIKGR